VTRYLAPAVLGDAYEKVGRATARRRELDSAIAALSGSDYYRIEAGQQEDGWTTVRARVLQEPPRALSSIFAEAALPLRSALDYLANELAVLNGKGRKTSFPIYRSKEDYERDRARLLRGVHVEHGLAIEQLQPYAEEPPEGHPLLHLADITNADKHSGLLPAFVRPTEHATELTFSTPVDDFETMVAESRPIHDGDEILRVRVVPPTSIHLNGRINLDVAFGAALYTRSHLDVIGRHVLWILDVFGEAWGHPRQIPDAWGAIRVGGPGPWEGHAVLTAVDSDGGTTTLKGPLVAMGHGEEGS
jgi:hypothetical protein